MPLPWQHWLLVRRYVPSLHTTDSLLCCDDDKKLGSNLLMRYICLKNVFVLIACVIALSLTPLIYIYIPTLGSSGFSLVAKSPWHYFCYRSFTTSDLFKFLWWFTVALTQVWQNPVRRALLCLAAMTHLLLMTEKFPEGGCVCWSCFWGALV